MFGVSYLKSGPTTFVIQYVNGKAVREGTGLSMFYFAPSSVIVKVPVSSVDVPFVFNEISADFQDVTIQGQLSYRIVQPKRLSQILDYSVDARGRYLSEDPKKLGDRLISLTQVQASTIAHRLKLKELLGAQERLVSEVLGALRASETINMLGVEILGLSIIAIKPTPDTAKALEAEAREAILRLSDEAIYARRNAAVMQERLIKESELDTELSVEAKQRQIREAKMQADIAVEEQRATLIERRADNERKDADTKAYALTAMLDPVKQLDWRTLTALTAGKSDSRLAVAMAFRELAENASKIGQLTITPELLSALLDQDENKKPRR